MIGFFVISLQPAAMVGNVANVVGTDIVTPTHEVVFGFYNSMTLDLSSAFPLSCDSKPVDNESST